MSSTPYSKVRVVQFTSSLTSIRLPTLLGLISRPLFVFLINDHSTGITVRRTFGTDSHLSTDTQQNSHSSVSFKYTKKVTESGGYRKTSHLLCRGGEVIAKAAQAVSPIKEKVSVEKEQCRGVL